TSAYNMDTTELNSPSALHLDVTNRSYSHTPTQRSLTQFDVPGRFIYSPATFSSLPFLHDQTLDCRATTDPSSPLYTLWSSSW
ncbi:hypothetical protein K474DRAFT_1658840, partial [Panus rudis PR-1116 ss-1]